MTSDLGTTQVSKPSDVEIRMSRVFAAPAHLVWAAHTEPELIQQWQLGPDGWAMPICQVDLRPGGRWRCVWRSTQGQGEFELGGEYLQIEAPHRLVQTEGLGDGPKGVTTTVLTELDGQTLLTVTMTFPSQQLRDEVLATGMADGASISYDRLDQFLARK
jgi:uncharacterized protein YndB with AHSA1/START domain